MQFAIFLHFMTGWMNKGEISLLHCITFFWKSLSLSTQNGNHFISNINSYLPRDFRFRNPNPKSIFQKIITAWHSSNQIHYREVLQWEIFMEQELRFGLDLGRLALLKKRDLGRLWATFKGVFFHVLRGNFFFRF